MREQGSTPLRAIVKAFDLVVKANALVGSQRYTYEERLHEIIMEGRKAYKSLIQCVIVVEASLSYEEVSEAKKGLQEDEDVDHEAEIMDDENDALDEVLSEAGNFDSGSDVDILNVNGNGSGKTFLRRQRGRLFKGNWFKKLLALLNVHAGLHLAKMAREYAIVMNVNVLVGELVHM